LLRVSIAHHIEVGRFEIGAMKKVIRQSLNRLHT
jgi:hypothetical protein